ncbi:Wzz/FepE/Etk N-terminal domain-containing protein [Dehalobacter sp.]|uniref:YveK family protein n=1 Tax=Dehalobacter sp. TaxID=1962289 RepID=UPI0025864151|nr:Wzz/FepE/Etk N-terminal domain-containing protein [Dehalobacter sp.]MCG1024360.1 lipopolysaccharide biosynthesis protein [Dehalobacter sp.]
MEIRQLLNAVIRKWWLVVVLAIFGGGIGYYSFMYDVQPMYSASTTLYVLNQDKVTAGQTLNISDITMGQQLLQQYSGIFNSHTVAVQAAKYTNDILSPDQIASMIEISNDKNSNILTLTATSSDPKLSITVSNAMGRAFIEQIKTMTKADYINVLDRAQIAIPVDNNGIQKALICILFGMFFSVCIIYVIEYFDTTVRSAEDIVNGLKLQVIGIIPEHDIQ